MKLTELIQQLETLCQVHGDMDVCMYDTEGDAFHVSDVSTNVLDGEVTIILG